VSGVSTGSDPWKISVEGKKDGWEGGREGGRTHLCLDLDGDGGHQCLGPRHVRVSKAYDISGLH
jgi:hypothetical protein